MIAQSPSIDLNADLAEGFPNDARLLALVTSAAIACGAHAGDEASILSTLRLAKSQAVAIGAHPGFPDREGFGRIERRLKAGDVTQLILRQFAFLKKLADPENIPISFLKPHGALYNQAQREPETAQGVIAAASALALPLLGQPGSLLQQLAKAASIKFIAEGFPERRYQPDGSLVPRSLPNAILSDPAEIDSQVVRLLRAGIATLCIHGDDPDALAKAELVRLSLSRHGIVPHFWGP